MTNRHPLHPKLIDALSEYRTCDEAMRAAYDLGVKRCVDWLKNHAAEYAYEDYYGPCFNDNGLLEDFREAMCPTQEDNNE